MAINATRPAQDGDPLSGNYAAQTNALRAESRGGSFAAGVMSHAVGDSAGLAEAQQRYAHIVPRSYRQAGVTQLAENAKSAVSVGLSPDDPRTGVFLGSRYVTSSNVGRAASTAEAQPVFDEAPEGGAA